MARKTRHGAWTLRDVARRARVHATMLDRHAATLTDTAKAWGVEERAREMRRFAEMMRFLAKSARGPAPPPSPPKRAAAFWREYFRRRGKDAPSLELPGCNCEVCVAFRRQVKKQRKERKR